MNHFSKPKSGSGNQSVGAVEFSADGNVIIGELPLSWDAQADPKRSLDDSRGNHSFWRKELLKRFEHLSEANVNLVELDGSTSWTTQVGDPDQSDLRASVVISDQEFFKRILFGGTIGSAESYIDGQWVSDDLTTLIRIMIRNLDRFTSLERGWAWLKNAWYFLRHQSRRNSIDGSRKNIRDHYDLGNDFYELFLDPTMNYSCGIFASPSPSDLHADLHALDNAEMEAASIRKMDLVCQKLQLSSKDHVLEIGTGWGGLAIYMAKSYGCRVTTTTISQAQYAKATQRALAEGLADQVDVLLQDYRELSGKFNKIVSIEMIEAVGYQYYDEYFSRCSKLLTDDGVMLLQAITIGEQNYEHHRKHIDFIRKYVFPGGCLPSIAALLQSVGRVTNMRMLHQEDITPHYVITLRHWRRQFMSKLDEVRRLGYDDAFIRLWHFYLCYCEAAFSERRVHNVHLMFAKSNCPIDPSTARD